jgi:molecular chaperone GrpE
MFSFATKKEEIMEDKEIQSDEEQVFELENSSTTENQEETDVIQAHLSEIEELKSQIELLKDKALRTVAESDNTRKRLEKMIDDARDYSIVSFAKDLLAVMDNLGRALEYRDKIDSVLTGVDMTKLELETVLKKYGIEALEPSIGDKFDYNNHHAVSQVVTDEQDSDSIVGVMQVGYRIKDRLLRPALVTVSKRNE